MSLLKSPLIPPLPAPPPLVREFEFSEQDFERIRAFIRRKAGIALNPSKKDMVYGRLVKRIREFGLSGFSAYLDLLDSPAGRNELENFVNALTTNLTYFFREEHHFPILAEHLQARAQAGATELSIWCSAASTGEEPYSLAITACEALAGMARPPRVEIVASDLDTSVLRQAAEGTYTAEAVAKLPAPLVGKYFDRQPDGRFRAKPLLRGMVRFQRINLVEPVSSWGLRAPFDAIFCRNVMIYFDRPTQLEVLAKFAPLLKPDGLLFVGHSENFYQASERFRLRGKTVYERT